MSYSISATLFSTSNQSPSLCYQWRTVVQEIMLTVISVADRSMSTSLCQISSRSVKRVTTAG